MLLGVEPRGGRTFNVPLEITRDKLKLSTEEKLKKAFDVRFLTNISMSGNQPFETRGKIHDETNVVHELA